MAIGRAGCTVLVPNLLLYDHVPRVAETLLRFDAGQRIIDQWVERQKCRTAIRQTQQDLNCFGLFPELTERHHSRVFLWYWLEHNVGQDAGQAYVNLLLNAARKGPSLKDRYDAVIPLVILRVKPALPILRDLPEPKVPTREAGNDDRGMRESNAPGWSPFVVRAAIEFLETPAS